MGVEERFDDSLRIDDLEAELMRIAPPVPAPTLATPTLRLHADEPPQPYSLGELPDSPWQSCFADPRVQKIEVVRPRLYQAALESDARWINFSAGPGGGRTTLLRQVAEDLLQRGERFTAVWTLTQASELRDEYLQLYESGRLQDLVREYRLSPTVSRFTLLIDDFDLAVLPAHFDVLRVMFEELPGFRLITTTFNSLDASPVRSEVISIPFREALNANPAFNYDECSDYLTRALISLGRPAPSEAEMREVFRVTRGVVLGVALGADLLARGSRTTTSLMAQMMQLVRRYSFTHYPPEILSKEFSLLTSTLSLMPRFRDHHLSLLFPEASRTTIWQIESMPLLDSNSVSFAGEHVWAEDYWSLILEWNATAGEDRRLLASRLSHIGDASGAFEQWLFAGDLARCDRALRARFLTIFEDMTPEAEQHVLGLSADELRDDYPMLRELRALLDPHTSAQDFALSASNLVWIAKKGSTAQSLLTLALRAAILARTGRRSEAVAQAEQVLAECPDKSSWEMNDEDGERLTYSEALLTVTLVLLACGTIPKDDIPLPSCTGCSFLMRRRGIAQALLDIARNPVVECIDIGSKRNPLGYRALIFSPRQCFDDIEAFEAGDLALSEALELVKRETATGVSSDGAGVAASADEGRLPAMQSIPRARRLPSLMQAMGDCLEHMLSGNLPAAVKSASQESISQPGSAIARAVVSLAKGEPGKSIAALDTLKGAWGPRTAAIEAVVRACALRRRSQEEPARLTLFAASSLPEVALVEGFSLIPLEDGEALVALHAELAPVFSAARKVGLLGTGVLISDRPPMRALTKKEKLVLDGLRRGLNTREIANEIYLSVNTVRTHVRAIAKKLDASGQADILRRAWQLGLIKE